jgi:hypothetical protein
MSLRCDHCRNLQIKELRCIVHQHHSSLLQLKDCAESQACDMCALFWECLRSSCHKDSIRAYLDGRQSDPVHLRDTTIFLQGYLPDTGSGAGPISTQMVETATIQVSSGEFESSRVHGTVSVYAKPGKFIQLLVLPHCTASRHLKYRLSMLTSKPPNAQEPNKWR